MTVVVYVATPTEILYDVSLILIVVVVVSAIGGDWDSRVAAMPQVGRKVAMVLQFEHEVTTLLWFKYEVVAVLQVNCCLVGSGWVALLFCCFSTTAYDTCYTCVYYAPKFYSVFFPAFPQFSAYYAHFYAF